MLTIDRILTEARRIAKCPQYMQDSVDSLNAVLNHLCLTEDLAASRGLYTFNFNPGLSSPLFPNFVGSGPYNLPVDFLRASGSSGESQKTYFWTLNGVPYIMKPCDLSDFDVQVKQAGLQSYPYLLATDLANAGQTSGRLHMQTAAALTLSNTMATPAKMYLDGTPTGTVNFVVGDGIAGEGIMPGTTITAIGSTTITLSQPALATLPFASIFTGVMPTFFTYPPPSGSYPVTMRYQRLMPPVTDVTGFCWFPDDQYLIDAVAGLLMQITDDSRTQEFIGNNLNGGRSGRRLREFLENTDDKRNRPQSVELDSRRFGVKFSTLRNTKTIGW